MYMFVFLREYCLCVVVEKTKKMKVSEIIRPQNTYEICVHKSNMQVRHPYIA